MKIDFKKAIPSYKAKPGVFQVVEIPLLHYLAIEGGGGPESSDYAAAIATLYPVAYTLKFMSKIELKKDYVVPPLQARWWADDWAVFTTKFDKTKWDWSAMLMTPNWIDESMFEQAVEKVAKKKNPPLLDRLRLIELDEGLCVQTLHVGPYSNEGPVLKEMHEVFIPGQGLSLTGKHHEIYLNDYRRVSPEKLRTVLRQQVAREGSQ
ncbi:MAG: GyrI-like domain-containing protein [Phycisphaeraceae bacterium]